MKEQGEEKSKRKISWCAPLLMGIRMNVDVIFMSTMTKRWTMSTHEMTAFRIKLDQFFIHSHIHIPFYPLPSFPQVSFLLREQGLVEMKFWRWKLWKRKHGSHFFRAFFAFLHMYLYDACVCLFIFPYAWNTKRMKYSNFSEMTWCKNRHK